ncbi:hypothetical protein Ae201684P_011211 [Aphanomyces euteiches]|nr:hypothetical protein Ae201684P_011211 [Aphanomyces euteiches]
MSDEDFSEDDIAFESDDDFEPASPPPKKGKSPSTSSKKRSKKNESDDSDDFDSEMESVKKTPKSTPSTKKPKEDKSKKKEEKPKDSKVKESKPAKEEKPKEILNQSQASEEVAKYLRQTNRPYSVLNVFENLHRRIGKTMLQKILDVLVEQGEINVKTYGKSQIYYYNQRKLPAPSAELLAKTEDSIQTVFEEVSALEKTLKEKEAVLNGLTSQMSDAELTAALADLENEASSLSAKLQQANERNTAPVDPGAKAHLTKSFQKYRTEWLKRKRIVMDAVDQIAEGMEKKRKDVMELCGVESDESVGVKEIPVLCQCSTGWTGADCSLRTCPSAIPWVDIPSAKDTVRTTPRECSNMGKCDRTTGQCKCQPGFEGRACDRQQCVKGCSGHGTCQSIGSLAVSNGFSYTLWDANRITGCVCDAGYSGYDCSQRACPMGGDPLTTKLEVQTISCQCIGSCSGSFTISFGGQTSAPISNAATSTDIQNALNVITTGVKVTLDGGSTACSLAGVSARVTFTQYFGSVQAFAVTSGSSLTVTVQNGGTAAAFGSTAATVAAFKQTIECSGRGICDRKTGQCSCGLYYTTSDGLGNIGTNADCGYRNTTKPLSCPAGIYDSDVVADSSTATCSGHGSCSGAPSFVCNCNSGWGGYDCSKRLCPTGRAWFDSPQADNVAHLSRVECSNVGNCDYRIGKCTCNPNFEGSACERLRCPNLCSQRGACKSLRQLAAAQEINGAPVPAVVYGSNPNAVATWDADSIFGCLCAKTTYVFGNAPRYSAFDCSDNPCPSGDDPWTQNQAQEVQSLDCTADGGTLTFAFRGYTTPPLLFSSNKQQLQNALQSLASIGYVGIDMPSGQLCTAASSLTMITFQSNAGDLPLLVVDSTRLTSSTGSVSAVVAERIQGTTEDVVCNNRGSCNATSGMCQCVRNFATSDGQGGVGSIGDCGYTDLLMSRDPIVNA